MFFASVMQNMEKKKLIQALVELAYHQRTRSMLCMLSLSLL